MDELGMHPELARRLNDLEKKIDDIGKFTGFDLLRKPKPGYQWTYYIEPGISPIYCFHDSEGNNYNSGLAITFYRKVAEYLRCCGNINTGAQIIAEQPNTIDAYITPTYFVIKYAYLFLQE